MDKSYRTEFHRTFLIDALPEPLTRASAHVQIFDNYITNTRIRIRRIRNPESSEWTHILQQRFPANGDEPGVWKFSEMYLNEDEYAQLKIFEGDEIRKNRYFHEFDGQAHSFDLYLGELWGLTIARIEFANADEMVNFEPSSFLKFEITADPFFFGESLVNRKFSEITDEVRSVGEIQSAELQMRRED